MICFRRMSWRLGICYRTKLQNLVSRWAGHSLQPSFVSSVVIRSIIDIESECDVQLKQILDQTSTRIPGNSVQFFVEHDDEYDPKGPLESTSCGSMMSALTTAARMILESKRPIRVRVSLLIEYLDGDEQHFEYIEKYDATGKETF